MAREDKWRKGFRRTILVAMIFIRLCSFVGGRTGDELVGERGFVVRLLVLVVRLLLVLP